MLDLQNIVNRVAAGLSRQGFERSEGPNKFGGFSCAYRGAFGRKCAIGHLISDELYDPLFENVLVRSFSGETLTNIFGDWPSDRELYFLSRLQMAHDEGFEPATMKNKLREVIVEFGLLFPLELEFA